MNVAAWAKALVGGLVSVVVNVLAQPGVQSGWHLFWTSLVAYVVGHVAVYLTPNKE
jgi:hypothetical protein